MRRVDSISWISLALSLPWILLVGEAWVRNAKISRKVRRVLRGG